MKKKITKKINQAIGLAAIAGMRSMSAPAFLSNYMTKHPNRRLGHTALGFMQKDKTANIFKLLAAAEMIGDKLPATPNRIKFPALLGRGISGALVGATVARSQRKRSFGGAGIGLAAAIASTYISYYTRKKLSKGTFIPDPVWGALEDVFVIKSGRKLLGK